MTHHLHFTFGPVQTFVAQARRTRDLYAGSLLLSHLAMAAMRGAKDAGGDIVLPNFTVLAELAPNAEHASAPNRFEATYESESSAAEAGKAAQTALNEAWKTIANAVWAEFLETHAHKGCHTADIWNRQVDSFWNIAWVVSKKDDSSALDRRKNWQTHWPPKEGGDHCVLMGQWQELSGYIRSQQRKLQDDFWKAIGAREDNLDLEPGERLCAIAFIKRFFPAVAEQAIGRKLDPRGWPSTVTIAALSWMRKIKDDPDARTAALAHAILVKDEPGATVSSVDRIQLLKEFPQELKSFAKLSGNFLNRTALANEANTPLKPNSDRKQLLDELRKLEDATQDRAGNFYALLLMDGDSMGALIREHGATKVTASLTDFSTKVPDTVKKKDGITIYAGGDDLLALLPLDRALDAAIEIHQLYAGCFPKETPATVSAAIVFAHYRCTFRRVLASAHDLLDNVAKDKTGRDSLAIRVLKPGGQTCEWSAPFSQLSKIAPHIFKPLTECFGEHKLLSSSLLYNLRERFNQIIDGKEATADRTQLLKLFTAEALIGKRDLENQGQLRNSTEPVMNQLLDVCEGFIRIPELPKPQPTGRFSFDGPRLIKFLALDGKERAE